jgi:hypothetical protein
MAAKRRYDEELRAIGQALEARDINVFVLKQLAENYVIEGMPDQSGSKVRQWLQRLRSGSSAKLLTLARADVERLSQTGKAKRSKWGQLTEFRKLSNSLRTIGAYLDSREVELLSCKKGKFRSHSRIGTTPATNGKRTVVSLHSIGSFLSFAASAARSKKRRYNQIVKFSHHVRTLRRFIPVP